MKKKAAGVLMVILVIIAGAAVGTIFFLSQPQLTPSPRMTVEVN